MLGDENYFSGDATRDEVLKEVNIESANAVVIATNDDNVNLYVLVTAKGIAPKVKTVVRVNRSETESKFRSVGADLMLPAGTMLGRMMTQAAVSPVAQDLLVRLQTGTAAPSLEEIPVAASLAGKPARETFPTAIAIYRDGAFFFDLSDLPLREKDVVLKINAGARG